MSPAPVLDRRVPPTVHSSSCDRNNGPSLCPDCVNALASFLEGK